MEMSDDARAGAYAVLAHLYRAPPDSALLRTLAAMPLADDTQDERDVPPLARKLAQATRALSAASASADKDTVAAEFNELFLGIEGSQAYPYGSIHRSGYFMDADLATLRTELRQLGLSTRREMREPEDHLAALCEAMRHLSITRTLPVQARFFMRHIGTWYESFIHQLDQAPTARYYRAVGRFTEAFFALEAQAFELVASEDTESSEAIT